MKVAVFSTKSFDRVFFDRYKDERHQFTYFEAPLNAHTTNLCQGFDAVCVFVNDRLTADVLPELAAQNVQLIALRCAGFNNVDLEVAHLHGLRVVRVPQYSPPSVAEHAVALIMALNRKTHKAYNRVREGNFSLERLEGFNLYGKTVGVVGTGFIGSFFCNIMLGFGCRVLAFDLYPSEELKAKGVHYVSFDELLAQSDILSLHCPLNEHTYHLIDAEGFAKMKDGVMLINTSRGGLIQTQDAIDALKHKKLGYLGIDVYEQEEHLFFRDLSESIIQDDLIARLIGFPNVLITAHQGFFTQEALTEITLTTLQNIQDFAEGGALKNEVVLGP